MTNKLKFLIQQSLKKKVSTKWFKIVNIFILILLIGVFNLDQIIHFFGGDFEEVKKIYVHEDLGVFELFENNFETLISSSEDFENYEIEKSDEDVESLKNKLEDKNLIVLDITLSDDLNINGQVYSYDPLNSTTEQFLQMSLNNVKNTYILQNSNLSENEIISLTSNAMLDKVVTNPNLDENSKNKDVLSSGLILVFIIPFFLLITMLTQMLGAEINDEKSTRGMEIIISNVSPKIHFLSKIIASTLFVFIQFGILIFDIFIAIAVRNLFASSLDTGAVSSYINNLTSLMHDTGIFELIWPGVIFILLLFLFSFLSYAIVAGVFASMTTNIEDYQQLQTPLMIILMVGYYIAIMSSTLEGSLFIKIVSYIPLLSFLVAPVIYFLGQITLVDLILSTLICFLATCLFFHYGLRIYKVGILNYSSQNLWTRIFKSLKKQSE